MTPRQKLVLTVIPAVCFVAALGCEVADVDPTIRIVLLLSGVLTLIGAEILGRYLNRRFPPPKPELTETEAAELRVARDEEGVVAATARLRERYPRLSLGDAVTLVREL